ncbi:TetR family transcriptional regulator C-terminal domain-containing protein [Bernardetia sp.]|uniref:TetR family transcriptional regulator C-terminal domain-containing protein n=1 Tax=Bernardetia sp. TaxID=1937974 RepID=UPI0025C4D7D0|nr:TetR family transcriptional regulator C-terminal domain-containing protein [Bernardetia sp.]
MENTTTSAKEQIKSAFITYIRQHGKAPNTPYNLMAELGEDEKFFYDNYSSFMNVEQEIWGEYLSETVQRLRSESVYDEYMVREKLLAFYFTLIEVLKENRSFVVNQLSPRNGGFRRRVLSDFKDGFYEYINLLLEEGMDTGEVEQRMFVGSKYDKLLWAETEFLIRFWLRDDSKNFERTDAAVEKTVNFAMDLIGRNIADSAFDFVKFLFQRK